MDYNTLLSDPKDKSTCHTVHVLRERLPSLWRDAYLSTITHEPNLVRFRHRTFEYICDLYSQLEITGEVPYDQTIADRVIGVLGLSSRAQGKRNARRGFELGEDYEGTDRDGGHFMARSFGGDLDVNLFPQQRHLNRGWSPQGKKYRQMERYCYEQPGTFCFSHPIYADGSSVPRWLEFGVLKDDATLWVEVFEN
jgi:hypothetical protein